MTSNPQLTTLLVNSLNNMSEAWWINLALEFNSGLPVYKQIVNQICAALASGQLSQGDQLPTIRSMQEKLQVNPNTVAKAYRELEQRGMIVGERGSGSYVKSGTSAALDKGEQRARLDSFYQHILSEAAGFGVTETELMNYICEKNKP